MKKGVTKQELIKSLEVTMKLTREGIENLELIGEDIVVIHFDNGNAKAVSIACDSGMAIIRDISKSMEY